MDNLQATNTGAIIENSEHINIGYSAGGDIHITEVYTDDIAEGFADINTDAYSEAYYTQPAFAPVLMQQLADRRLLILSGGSGFDKNEFARHIAFLQLQESPGIEVKEWRASEDDEDILKNIREKSGTTLFIIPDCVPQHVAHDVAQLAAIVRQHQHFVILTTDLSQATWQQPEAIVKLYWYEIPASNIYSGATLSQYLARRINANRTLFGIPLETEVNVDTLFAGPHSPLLLSKNFDSPEQINFFLVLMEADHSDKLLEEKIAQAIFTIKDKSETLVTKWYRSLSSTERLIALGAAMLDGLFDDQFFAVMQHIVNDFWHYRDNRLQSLDYCDLDFLLNFFSFEVFDDGRQLLVCKFPGQRAEIIRAAWQSNKRHILSAFGTLTALAGSSSAGAAGRISHPEINGTRERGKRLRAVAAETISDIGIVSLQTAEPKLVELAASADQTTRRITAKAMARWRAFGKDEQMYETLSRWQKRSNNVRSTAVFTLAYAAEYDGPGQLDQRIINLLDNASGDPAVRGPMKDILQKLIESHLTVIQNDLRDYFAVEPEYSDVITGCIAQLYNNHPHEIKTLLEDWLNSCSDQVSLSNRRNALTYRDNRLVLILRIYRSLSYGSNNDVITLSYVWSLLDRLHSQEQRAGMRAFILETAAYMIGTQPEQAIGHIEPVFKKLGIEGRQVLIHSIGRVYLYQRAALQGGHYVVQAHNLQIPVWWNAPRPITEIENVLYGWLTGSNSFAREVATLAFVEFAVLLDRDEPQLIQVAIQTAVVQQQEQNRRQQEDEQRRRMEAAVVYPVMPELSLWTQLKIFFWLIFCPQEEKLVLKEVMNVLLMYRKTNPAYLAVLIQRWNVHGSERVRRMAWWVGKLMNM